MQLQTLDHYAIRTADVAATAHFYQATLNMVPGPRPPFRFPGAWLYPAGENGEPSGHSLVHLIGVDPNDRQGLTDYLGAKEPVESGSTGNLDHVAFRATGFANTCETLRAHGIPFRQRRVPEMNLQQVFIVDPNGITIELNYGAAEDLAAAGFIKA